MTRKPTRRSRRSFAHLAVTFVIAAAVVTLVHAIISPRSYLLELLYRAPAGAQFALFSRLPLWLACRDLPSGRAIIGQHDYLHVESGRRCSPELDLHGLWVQPPASLDRPSMVVLNTGSLELAVPRWRGSLEACRYTFSPAYIERGQQILAEAARLPELTPVQRADLAGARASLASFSAERLGNVGFSGTTVFCTLNSLYVANRKR